MDSSLLTEKGESYSKALGNRQVQMIARSFRKRPELGTVPWALGQVGREWQVAF